MRLEKDIKYSLLAFLFIVCEMAFGKYIAIFGAVPMLVLCFCVVSSIVEEDNSYIVTFCTIIGAICDILACHGFGTYTISFAFASYVTVKLKDNIFASKNLFLILDIFVVSVIIEIFYVLVHISKIGAANIWYNFSSIILPMSIYNTLICVLYYPLHRKIFSKRRGGFC